MSRDQKFVEEDFLKLKNEDRHAFPTHGTLNNVPKKQCVYIIYSPRKEKIVHVGRTYRGTAGLRQRLNNHLHGSSSFTIGYLKGHGKKLRNGYTFRYLPLPAWRRRAFLEAYATGVLCPIHIGKHQRK